MRILVLLAILAARTPDPPRGTLVVVGGGGTTPEIVARALASSGGTRARVLVVPQASARPEAGKESAEMWTSAGAASASILDLADRDAALAAVKAADLIWMSGGDQSRLVRALADAGVGDAIRSRFAEGATVGGTSAGAAAMSKAMITGEADLESVTGGATELVDGLGLWPDAIVDQHFLKRRRFNRLLGAVLDRPELVGVGIDEKTAVVLHGRAFEVVGAANVVVIDGRRASAVRAKKGEPAAGANLAVHVLASGAKFDLDRGPVVEGDR